jgi:hypothetical protein
MSNLNIFPSTPSNNADSQRSRNDAVSVLTSSQSTIGMNSCPFKKEKKTVITDCYFNFGEEMKNDRDLAFRIGTCLCGTTVKWIISKGVGNLYSHVIHAHASDYIDQVKEYERQKRSEANNLKDSSEVSKVQVQTILSVRGCRLVSDKAKSIASWLQWVIEGNLPFVFVEKDLTRKFTKLDSISTSTLMKYLQGVTDEIVSDLHEEIKQISGKIGL